MPINLADVEATTKPGMIAFTGDYHQLDDEWKQIYTIRNSEKSQEQEWKMRFLGPAAQKQEGGPIQVDTMGQRYLTTAIHQTVANSFAITKEAIEDNLYKSQFPRTVQSLKNSLRTTKNIFGASPLNNGFDANYLLGDGKPLFSATHPTDAAEVNNLGTVQFSIEGIEEGYIGIQKFTDLAGNTVSAMPEKLVVGVDLSLTADRILNSEFLPGSMNNDINSIKRTMAIPKGYVVNRFITNPNSYFILTNVEDCFIHYIRTRLETGTYTDFSTEVVLHKATERYCFVVTDPLGAWGFTA